MTQAISIEQREFFDLEDEALGAALPEVEQRRRFTAERVARNQQVYRCVVALLGVGFGVERIAETLRLSEHSVRAIRDREAATVAGDKERFGGECLRTAAKLRVRVEDQVEEMSGKDAAIALGILTEKGLLLTGSATAIVETKRAVSADDVRAAFERCVRLANAKPAELASESRSDDGGAISGGNGQDQVLATGLATTSGPATEGVEGEGGGSVVGGAAGEALG